MFSVSAPASFRGCSFGQANAQLPAQPLALTFGSDSGHSKVSPKHRASLVAATAALSAAGLLGVAYATVDTHTEAGRGDHCTLQKGANNCRTATPPRTASPFYYEVTEEPTPVTTPSASKSKAEEEIDPADESPCFDPTQKPNGIKGIDSSYECASPEDIKQAQSFVKEVSAVINGMNDKHNKRNAFQKLFGNDTEEYIKPLQTYLDGQGQTRADKIEDPSLSADIGFFMSDLNDYTASPTDQDLADSVSEKLGELYVNLGLS